MYNKICYLQVKRTILMFTKLDNINVYSEENLFFMMQTVSNRSSNENILEMHIMINFVDLDFAVDRRSKGRVR